MRKSIITATALALTATLAFAAPQPGERGAEGKKSGKHGFHGAHAGKGAGFERFAQKLNLSEAQKLQLTELRNSFHEQNKPFMEAARETRKQYREARRSNDTARVAALQPQIDAQREQMKELRTAQHARMLTILTPEQQAQLETMKSERGERKGKRHGRGMGHGGGHGR